MKKINYLIKIMQDFINNNMNSSQFVDKYESFFSENEDVISKENKKSVYDIFLDLNHDLGYFEPNKLIRKESESYYGEEKLLIEVKKAYTNLKKLIGEKWE